MYKILIALIATFCFVGATSYAQIDGFKFSSVAIKNATMKAKPVAKKNVKPAVVVIAKEIKESGIKTGEMVYRNQRGDVISKDAWEYNKARKGCGDSTCAMGSVGVGAPTSSQRVDPRLSDPARLYSCGTYTYMMGDKVDRMNVRCSYKEHLYFKQHGNLNYYK